MSARATFILAAGALSVLPTNEQLAGRLDPVAISSCRTTSGDFAPPDQPVESPASAILELRRRSGLTWEQLANLFGVDRRTVHLWASGKKLNADNATRVGKMLAAVRAVARSTPAATRDWLVSIDKQGRQRLDTLLELPPEPMKAKEKRPKPQSAAAKAARLPMPPESLLAAADDPTPRPRGRLIRSIPIARRPS